LGSAPHEIAPELVSVIRPRVSLPSLGHKIFMILREAKAHTRLLKKVFLSAAQASSLGGRTFLLSPPPVGLSLPISRAGCTPPPGEKKRREGQVIGRPAAAAPGVRGTPYDHWCVVVRSRSFGCKCVPKRSLGTRAFPHPLPRWEGLGGSFSCFTGEITAQGRLPPENLGEGGAGMTCSPGPPPGTHWLIRNVGRESAAHPAICSGRIQVHLGTGRKKLPVQEEVGNVDPIPATITC
jgi:hypothetical protein